MRKTIVIGIDGGSWVYIDKWIKQGLLPNIARCREKGSWGVLKPCLPPVTSPNWKCYSTGLNPGKLGQFGWERIDTQKRKVILPRSYLYEGKEIWDYLSMAGKKVGVVNMPTMHPPKKINGFVISGGPDALEYNFTYPKELEKELKAKYDYRVLPENSSLLDQGDPTVIKELLRLIELRFEVALDLMKKHDLDLLHVTIYLINVLQHFYWDDDNVLKAWKLIDQGVGKLLEAYPDHHYVFMSDHGTNKIKFKFNINQWLIEQGYLKLNKTYKRRQLLVKYGINLDRVLAILTKLKIKDILKKFLPDKVQNFLPRADGAIQETGREQIIDWEKSKVVGGSQGPLYIIAPKDSDEFKKIAEEIINKLESLEHEGVKIVRKVNYKHEVYSGSEIDKAPDLMIDQGDGIHITGSIGFKKIFEEPNERWKGENNCSGLFMAYGKDIKEDNEVEDVSILDLAPTILDLMDVQGNDNFDGKILKQIYVDND